MPKTDFPKKGDDKQISLRNSNYPQFDFAFAQRIKENHPRIWGKGGNIRGNEAFEYWSKARAGEKTDGVLDWIKEREAWAARHEKDFRIAGVIAAVKWGVIVSRGESYMKDLINEEIDKAKASRTVEMPIQTRNVEIQVRALDNDSEARMATLIWSSGSVVRRSDWDGGYYDEELVISEDTVRMDRLSKGAPVLMDHRNATSSVVGVVERAWIENGLGYAEIRFSNRDDISGIYQDVKDGILRNISFGYRVYKYEVEKRDNNIPLYRAVDIEPMEISIVAIPADSNAGFVRNSEEKSVCEIVDLMTVPENSIRTANEGDHSESPEEEMLIDRSNDIMNKQNVNIETRSAQELASEAVRAERSRVAEIRKVAKSVGLEDMSDDLIERGVSIEEARAEILNKVSERQVSVNSTVKITVDEVDTMRSAVENALMHRGGIVNELTAPAREWRGLSLVETAREILKARGVSVRGLSSSQVVEAALTRTMHSTSDFPLILSNVTGKALRQAYEAAPQTFRPLVRVVEVPDFKPVTRVQLGDAPRLEKVKEGGEFTRGTMDEASESYKIDTYGKVIAITRQTIINDDLDAFTRVPTLFGREAADLESDLVWSIINDNPAMGDGVSLFDAAHANLAATAAGISVDSVAKLEELMLEQTSLNDRRLVVRPQYLIVRPARKLEAQKLLGSIVSSKTGDVNPYQNAMELIVEPRLEGTAWYMAATPAQIDMIELAYLSGARGLQTFQREGFDVDGIEVKVRMDVGAKAIDWRGFAKNPGN